MFEEKMSGKKEQEKVARKRGRKNGAEEETQ